MYKNHIIHAWKTIGSVYYHGCTKANVAQDRQTAFFWYQSAALAHVNTAQYKIGMMLVDGDGVPRDRDRGIEWLTSAAIEGSTQARSYLEGLGMHAPATISPNSYETYQELARQELIKGQQQDRAAIMRDVGNLAVKTVQLVSQAVLVYSVTQNISSVPAPTIRYVQRSRPAYCTVYANSSEGLNTTYINARVFCH